jgi:hypothetical protein
MAENSAVVSAEDDLFAPGGSFEVVQSKAASKLVAKDGDDIGKHFESALKRYNAGQFKAAIAQANDAIKKLAIRESLHRD